MFPQLLQLHCVEVNPQQDMQGQAASLTGTQGIPWLTAPGRDPQNLPLGYMSTHSVHCVVWELPLWLPLIS